MSSPNRFTKPQTKIDAPNAKAIPSLASTVLDLHLLDRYKVITDKVWDDIWITELEAAVVDTYEFQRLHWILQLGAAIFVYPDASHTRFDHALGTLEATDRIVRACNDNHSRYRDMPTIEIDPYCHLLARLGGLTHDLAQMPYAHTLDSQGEGHLFDTEWKNESLRAALLGKDGFLERTLKEHFNKKFGGTDKRAVSYLIDSLVSDLDWVLASKDDDELPTGRKYLSFVRDIIGNTLCADLVDYVQRDLLSSGFRDRVSLRPLQFFCVKELNGVPKLALALFKPKTPSKMREDVVFEAIEFLRKRYSLGERVYFHHAKIAASAMVIKAIESSGLQCDQIWDFGDHALLRHLQALKDKDGSPHPASTIATLLLRRDLFKLAYELRHRDELDPGGPVDNAKKYFALGPQARDHQRWLEETLAQGLEVDPNSIAVYSSNPNMNLKTFEALVWPKRNQEPRALKNLKDAVPESEELMRKHRRLWHLAVFVRRDLFNIASFGERLERLCNALLEKENVDFHILADVYVESHKDEFVSNGLSWSDRDKVVTIVKNALAAKERGGFSFPRVRDVLAELRKQ